MSDLQISGGRGDEAGVEPLPVPSKYSWTIQSPAMVHNVAQAYALLANDIRNGTHDCPDFDDAVLRHRMVDAIERSAVSGKRVTV